MEFLVISSSNNFCEKFHLVSLQKKTPCDMLPPYIHHLCLSSKSTNFQFCVTRPGYGCKIQALRKVGNFFISEFLFFQFLQISGSPRKQDLARLLVKLAGKTTKYKPYSKKMYNWVCKNCFKLKLLEIPFCETRWKIQAALPEEVKSSHRKEPSQISELCPTYNVGYQPVHTTHNEGFCKREFMNHKVVDAVFCVRVEIMMIGFWIESH